MPIYRPNKPTTPRGKPQISIQDKHFYFNKAFCFDHGLNNPASVRILYSVSGKLLRFAFSDTKREKYHQLNFKNGGAQLSHHAFSKHYRLKLTSYAGTYNPARVYENGESYEEIKLTPKH